MEHFTEEETERLNKILSVEVNPFLNGEDFSFELPLGEATQKWLFTAHMNLPKDARDELQHILSNDVAGSVRIGEMNDFLERRQVSSAPLWWELGFFDFNLDEMWRFVAEQCRRHYDDEYLEEAFGNLIRLVDELNEARHVIWVSEVNSERYSEEEINAAIDVFHRSYPLDFVDYQEVPHKARSPYQALQMFISSELSDLEAVFSKKWFEFKILDELARFENYIRDGQRDSPLSKKISSQLRGDMFRNAMALGRMLEHYRWKFSYEAAALKGIQSIEADGVRGRKGGDASSSSKRQNIQCLLEEIECLGDLHPRISEDAIFEQAYINASNKRKMPKTRKTIDEYGTIIRSHREYKPRYDAIFRKKA